MRGIEAILPDVPVISGAADEIAARALTSRISAGFRGVSAKMCDAVVDLASASSAADNQASWPAGEILLFLRCHCCGRSIWFRDGDTASPCMPLMMHGQRL